MARNLYSPKLADDVVRLLYREGQRRRMPMTRSADLILRKALGIDARHLLHADCLPFGGL